jgi:hypothetical protein
LFSSPCAYCDDAATTLAPMVHAPTSTSPRSLSELAGMPGIRSPGRTTIAPFASAAELLGLDATKVERNVASMWL